MLLRNVGIKKLYLKWYHCNTCFIKLPVASLITILAVFYFFS